MKIQRFNDIKLNEGLRVNPKTIMLQGTYDIDELINELQSLYDEDDGIALPGTLFSLNLESELFYLLRDLRMWKKDGWKAVRGLGLEWIPLSSMK